MPCIFACKSHHSSLDMWLRKVLQRKWYSEAKRSEAKRSETKLNETKQNDTEQGKASVCLSRNNKLPAGFWMGKPNGGRHRGNSRQAGTYFPFHAFCATVVLLDESVIFSNTGVGSVGVGVRGAWQDQDQDKSAHGCVSSTGHCHRVLLGHNKVTVQFRGCV